MVTFLHAAKSRPRGQQAGRGSAGPKLARDARLPHARFQQAQPCRAQAVGSFLLVLLWLALRGPQMAVCPSITDSILAFLFAVLVQAFK